MKRIKDKKIIVLGAILFLFTIVYFGVVNKVSYAFLYDYDYEKAYENKVNVIIKSAEAYGEDNLDKFNEENLLYINVQELIDTGYMIPNSDGKIINIANSESMNEKKIRLKHENESIIAEIYS